VGITAGDGPEAAGLEAGLPPAGDTDFGFFAVEADMGPISLSEKQKAALKRGADGRISTDPSS
jgi:hypothetical protein